MRYIYLYIHGNLIFIEGADVELADQMHKELSTISRRINWHNITPQQRYKRFFLSN